MLERFGSSLAKMGNRAFVSLWLLAALLLVGLQHAVITAVPLRGPAGKTLKLNPGKVSLCNGHTQAWNSSRSTVTVPYVSLNHSVSRANRRL